MLDPSALGVVVFLFVVVVPFERLFPRHRQPFRRPALGTDLAYGLLQPLLAPGRAGLGIVIGRSPAWPGCRACAIRPLVDALPGALRVAAGVLLFDLVTYWVHRWSHEVPFLWRFHSVHHSTEHLDWISGLRAHPFDGALLAPPFVFLLAAGFGAELAGVLAAVQVVIGLFLHANVRWRWRLLHRVVITPSSITGTTPTSPTPTPPTTRCCCRSGTSPSAPTSCPATADRRATACHRRCRPGSSPSSATRCTACPAPAGCSATRCAGDPPHRRRDPPRPAPDRPLDHPPPPDLANCSAERRTS